jgi:Mg2+-importing ATPase
LNRAKKQDDKGNIETLLIKTSELDIEQVFSELHTSPLGLSETEVEKRLERYGKNEALRVNQPSWYGMLLSNFKNPFILVLIMLCLVCYLTSDKKGALLVSIMVVVSVLMRFFQEFRSSRAAEALRMMVRTKATVKRISEEEEGVIDRKIEIPLENLVPGDIVHLSAGDMVPADVRLIDSKDLFISQSALTGESIPVEKYDIEVNAASVANKPTLGLLERNNLCFMGTSVVSGFGKAVVVATGTQSYFGSLSDVIVGDRPQTSFDRGVSAVTWVLIRFILIMVPIIFIINVVLKNNWEDSFLFAIAVAVGLTPEMLPMILTANLAKGAVAMSRLKVIVKRLNSIQSFGAMDVLCTDKTGTLTQDKIILEKYLDITGEESPQVLKMAFLNSYYQSGLKNMLDKAILDHVYLKERLNVNEYYKKVDEIPFDFVRKRMSVAVRLDSKKNVLICKGAVDDVLSVCSGVEHGKEVVAQTEAYKKSIHDLATTLNAEGFRVIAVAYGNFDLSQESYSVKDENNLIFLGLMAFLDPPKETAYEAIEILENHGIKVKVLTGDNDIITLKVCKQVGLQVEELLLGDAIEKMSDVELAKRVEQTTIFAKLTPLQKARIVKILQHNGRVVGFLGDGINDAPALREADVGVSVDSATDIARESADIILLEKSLLVLGEGVVKGREVYGNIIKYIRMTTSSNFGNVFSILIASAFLPFLPMLPLQLLTQNLLYDFSQVSLPWDKMDREFLRRPRKWDPTGIARFMVIIGPISSIFDITTFAIMWFIFKANTLETQALFQSGWFIEGLLSQTLIVHMIRTRKIPFIQSMAATPVILTTLLIMIIGIYFPFSALGAMVKLVPLPMSYFCWLFITLFLYCALVQLIKRWYIKKFKSWL